MSNIDRQATYTGTKEVAAPLRFDAARLEQYLASNAPGFKGPLSVKQFRGGQSNPTYMLETPARKYVLRRKPPGKLLPSAHAVDREFRAISALYPQGFPVAEPVVYCADETVAGTAFYVMSYVEGRVIWVPDMPDSNPQERAAVFDAMNATLAQLHSYDPAAIGLSDYGRGENYVARQVDRWSKQHRASETEKSEEMEGLMAWLPANLPPPAPVRLVHGDYRLDNMILHPREPRVLAVLDWELSTLGDPLADFTYHCMQWHMPASDSGAGTGSLVGLDLKALGIPSMSDYVDAYVERTGLDPRPTINVYSAYNFFRLAAILQGIVGRVRDGTATNENAPARAQMVRPLAAPAWELARPRSHRDRRGPRRDERRARRDRRRLDRRGDRRRLRGRAHRARDAAPSDPARARPRRGDAPRDRRAGARLVGAVRRGVRQSARRRCGQVLRRVHGRAVAGEFS